MGFYFARRIRYSLVPFFMQAVKPVNSAFIAALHFIGAFGVFATVFAEWVIFHRTPTVAEARRLQFCDTCYGLCAALVLVAGALRVFYFEKGSHFYLSNPLFLVKMTLFVIVGLLSIYPTVRFLDWRKATRANQAPTMTDAQFSLLQAILRLEVVLLVGIILAASLMAKGIGL
jgi:putative membrane protein